MADQKHIDSFRQFVRKHPTLITEVREGNKTWQNVYEDWHILGEEDDVWKPYLKEVASANVDAETSDDKKTDKDEGNNEGFRQILSMVKNIDMNSIQGHIANMSGAIGNIQELLEQFQASRQTPTIPNTPTPPTPPAPPQQNRNPFFFRQD
ncbi:YlbD family protein [Bacillus solimangrovi]|uniref:Cytosolic protein n=1 Tax=Bacillus solimangrovi TaxID=1305675 RepID=A0A1E5LIL1_9BACI|nr:YlbD family protein [Bacillus solimangrovi]OEH93923.1 hypothetical protein BFG57_10665 [Bacillus solimangrovi]